MGRTLRSLVTLIAFACIVLPTPPARSAPALERGTAITDPLALRELDHGRFGLTRVLLPSRSSNAPLTGSQLFALPSMLAVREAIDDEFDRYVSRHKTRLPNETIGVGTGFDFQLFDRAPLYSDYSRFVLAGIVNRMDRAYASPDTCGEIRLIYRLTRTPASDTGDGAASPRLPMTLNVVLKARGAMAGTVNGGRIGPDRRRTCRQVPVRGWPAGSGRNR
jgi:hypothetical protein